MTFASLRTYKSLLRIACCGLLLPFASLTTQAQKIAGPTILDAWRSSFIQQLNEEIGQLASARSFKQQEDLSSQTYDFSGLDDRKTGHWSTLIRGILESQGLPVSLVGVAEVESGFNPMARSPKGAAGLWQFMPDTARQYGLVVNATQDDRFDVPKSTLAAAHYLRQLYDQFDDWPLALAAYNAGPSRVGLAICRFNTHDFGTLSRNFSVPRETQNYVPKVLAASRSGLAGPDLELQKSTFGNRPNEAPETHFMHPGHRGEVVFAITSPEGSIQRDAK
jgi:soluble lytic murein transglycosylase-like protein